MRRIAFAIAVSFMSIISYGQSIRYDTVRYAREYYQKRVARFNNEQVVKGKIVFLGTSITESGDWKKLLNDSTVINRGVSGDNTFGILERLDEVTRRQPDKLFIEVGINDLSLGIPIEIITKNILAIVQEVKNASNGTTIYVQSILPTNDNAKNEHPNAFNKNHLINRINAKLKRKAKLHEFTYIDINKEFSDKDGKLKVAYADPDGLHLNDEGYQAWVKLLMKNKFL